MPIPFYGDVEINGRIQLGSGSSLDSTQLKVPNIQSTGEAIVIDPLITQKITSANVDPADPSSSSGNSEYTLQLNATSKSQTYGLQINHSRKYDKGVWRRTAADLYADGKAKITLEFKNGEWDGDIDYPGIIGDGNGLYLMPGTLDGGYYFNGLLLQQSGDKYTSQTHLLIRCGEWSSNKFSGDICASYIYPQSLCIKGNKSLYLLPKQVGQSWDNGLQITEDELFWKGEYVVPIDYEPVYIQHKDSNSELVHKINPPIGGIMAIIIENKNDHINAKGYKIEFETGKGVFLRYESGKGHPSSAYYQVGAYYKRDTLYDQTADLVIVQRLE